MTSLIRNSFEKNSNKNFHDFIKFSKNDVTNPKINF